MTHGNLVRANKGIHSSGSSFADKGRHNHGMLLHVNQFPVYPSRPLGLLPPVHRNLYGDTENCLGTHQGSQLRFFGLVAQEGNLYIDS